MIITPIAEIIFQLKNLKPGDRVTYYVGCLASNRSTMGDASTAITAYKQYENGRAHLVQRRLGPPVTYLGSVDWHAGCGPGFEYIAVGAAPKRKHPTFNAHLKSEMDAL